VLQYVAVMLVDEIANLLPDKAVDDFLRSCQIPARNSSVVHCVTLTRVDEIAKLQPDKEVAD